MRHKNRRFFQEGAPLGIEQIKQITQAFAARNRQRIEPLRSPGSKQRQHTSRRAGALIASNAINYGTALTQRFGQ